MTPEQHDPHHITMSIDNYHPHTRRSPLTDPWEPLLAMETPDAVWLALEIRQAHCNSRGFAHGGMISALADNAMGLSAVRIARRHPGSEKVSGLTLSLSVDFLDTARVGDFLEFKPEVLKAGRSIAFVDCRVMCADKLIARGSASFKFV